MTGLIDVDRFDEFLEIRAIRPNDVSNELRSATTALHEIHEIEDFLRSILCDRAATPHGPAEIVDILTHKLHVEGRSGLAAFVLKGRSYPTVRPKEVSHQIYRLRKISGLKFAILGTTGIVLDGVKEEFSSTCEDLGIQYAFMDADDFSRLFVAYGIMCPRDGTIIRGGRCHCGYAPACSLLNILQQDALDRLALEHTAGRKKCLIVLPTGAGKTRVAARDAARSGAEKILYIAHTHEILAVAEAEFGAAFSANAVSRTALRAAVETQVSLATVQQISRDPSRWLSTGFDYLVIDEFHHASARSYQAILDHLPEAFLLGMTATPFRGDHQEIAKICDGNVVVEYGLMSGIGMGVLAPYHYYGCFDDVDYSDLPASAAGYSARDLERKLIISARHRAAVEKWREKCDGKATLAFCCSRTHAQKVAEAFNDAGVPAQTYFGTTPALDRQRFTDQLRTGQIKILCVVDVLNEGADIPFVECLLFLRPTESKRIFFQQLGRGLRKFPGKAVCTVIDFIGNFRNAYRILDYHGLQTEAREDSTLALRPQTAREILDLPMNCTVTFEDRVLDIFAHQALHPRNINRSNIGGILLLRYQRLSRKLGRAATAKDVDRNELLHSGYYKDVFGSWRKFETIARENWNGGAP